MVVGIRGTCGWVTQDTAALLEGTVEVTAGEQSVTVTAGEMAFFTEDGKLEVRPLYAEDVPPFVAAEIGDQFPLEPRPSYSEERGLSFTSEKSYTLGQTTSDSYSDWDIDMGNGTAECLERLIYRCYLYHIHTKGIRRPVPVSVSARKDRI